MVHPSLHQWRVDQRLVIHVFVYLGALRLTIGHQRLTEHCLNDINFLELGPTNPRIHELLPVKTLQLVGRVDGTLEPVLSLAGLVGCAGRGRECTPFTRPGTAPNPYPPTAGSFLLLSFFATICQQIWQIFDSSPPKECRRLKWMVP